MSASDVRGPGTGSAPEPTAVPLPRDVSGGDAAPDTQAAAAQPERPLATLAEPTHSIDETSTGAQPESDLSPEPGRSPASAATLYDVARLAGVSTATVSRVVHGQDRVRDSTRARVREVIDQLGYVPDGAAQSLSRRQKNVIGLVCVERLAPHQYDIESMSLLFYDEILRGVEARIRDHNWSLLITYLREENNVDLARLQTLSGKVDGLLIGEGIVPSAELARLAERLPVVVVAGDPAEEAADVVTADNRAGSAALVTHLIEEHGRTRLYHVDGPPSAPDAKERRIALNEVVQSHPGTVLIGSHCGRFSVQSGEEAGEKILSNPAGMPDAVVCANDQMAIGVLQTLVGGGVKVPEQLSVTGFDDIFPGSLFEPSLTTVHQPMRLLGERACARLLDRIAKPDMPTQVELLPTELVLRKSCGCPPGTAARTLATSAPALTTSARVHGLSTEASILGEAVGADTSVSRAAGVPVARGRRHARPTSES
jgi:LacI family transcriptional regulator